MYVGNMVVSILAYFRVFGAIVIVYRKRTNGNIRILDVSQEELDKTFLLIMRLAGTSAIMWLKRSFLLEAQNPAGVEMLG